MLSKGDEFVFCNESVEEVFECMPEYDDDSVNWFFDCYHDMALHLTKGYRIILKTKSYFICIDYDGVNIVPNTENVVFAGEYLESCIHIIDENEEPWIDYESTLFVGEQLVDVKKDNGFYVLTFTDFALKVISHNNPDDIEGLRKQKHWSYNFVYGLDRLLTRKCDCGGTGEVFLDFVSDYVVRCNKCKKSTYAEMMVVNAIDNWNRGETPCDLSDIEIE